MILAYFQSSRGLVEVASKSPVLSVVCHKSQSWSLPKVLFCVACHALAYERSLCHVLNRPLAAKPSRDLLFIKLWAATLRMPENGTSETIST